MPYQYGMQTSPSGGNGLGGLPKKQTTPTQSTYTRIVTAGSGVIIPPANAKYMRVAVIGGGGGGQAQRDYSGSTDAACGGGGGGCAASKMVAASAINYSVGGGGAGNGSSGGDTTASFGTYSLVGRGGSGGSLTLNALGGAGIGGDYNYSGGSALRASTTGTYGAVSAGGGGAGPSGAGGNGSKQDGLTETIGTDGQLSNGWGCGGGGGGKGIFTILSVSGGGGAGADSGGVVSSVSIDYLIYKTVPIWGVNSETAYGAASKTCVATNGGILGGGGAATVGFDTGLGRSAGGVGGIVVEWFY